MPTMYQYTCKQCDIQFVSRRPYNTAHSPNYCSKTCADEARRIYPETTCKVCLKRFYPTRANSKLCSAECKYTAHRQRGFISCEICGVTFKRYGKKSRYCSQECYGKSMLSIHPRKSKEFSKAVRKAIKERDNYTCVLCGSNSNIQVDHILCIGLGGNNSIENGRVLCENCHKRKTTQDRKLIRRLRQKKN